MKSDVLKAAKLHRCLPSVLCDSGVEQLDVKYSKTRRKIKKQSDLGEVFQPNDYKLWMEKLSIEKVYNLFKIDDLLRPSRTINLVTEINFVGKSGVDGFISLTRSYGELSNDLKRSKSDSKQELTFVFRVTLDKAKVSREEGQDLLCSLIRVARDCGLTIPEFDMDMVEFKAIDNAEYHPLGTFGNEGKDTLIAATQNKSISEYHSILVNMHDALKTEVEITNNRLILNNHGIEHFAQTSQRDIKEIVDVVDADVQFGSAVAGSVIEHLQYNKKKLLERLDDEGRVQVASSLDGEKLIFAETVEGGYVVELVGIEPTAKQVKDFGFKS